jgi:hypothetical protein
LIRIMETIKEPGTHIKLIKPTTKWGKLIINIERHLADFTVIGVLLLFIALLILTTTLVAL